MGRSPCCEKVGLKKGPWTPEEDQKLLAFIEQHGHGSWRALPAKAGDVISFHNEKYLSLYLAIIFTHLFSFGGWCWGRLHLQGFRDAERAVD